jgi:hypothetical protein
VRTDDPVVLRLPVHWENWINVLLGAVGFPVGAVLAVRGYQHHAWLSLVIGIALVLLMFPLLTLSGREVLRRPVLRTRTLVLPRTFHRARRLELSEVSGVGLIYEAGGQRACWSLRVWMLDGNTYGIESVRTFARGQRQPNQPPPPPGTPRRHRPRLDWATLATTPAGRATAAIDRQVREIQGPGGALAMLAEQGTAPSYGTYLAYFSADGRIGWLADRPGEADPGDTDDWRAADGGTGSAEAASAGPGSGRTGSGRTGSGRTGSGRTGRGAANGASDDDLFGDAELGR